MKLNGVSSFKAVGTDESWFQGRTSAKLTTTRTPAVSTDTLLRLEGFWWQTFQLLLRMTPRSCALAQTGSNKSATASQRRTDVRIICYSLLPPFKPRKCEIPPQVECQSQAVTFHHIPKKVSQRRRSR